MLPEVATYRLQLNQDLGFEEARKTLDHLLALGISHVYTSPCFEAVEGSTHFYDIVDPLRVSEALGGEEGRSRFVQRLEALGMGRVVDFVPNHMAAAPENRWWWDVLKRGAGSPYAGWFDIDWEYSPKVELPCLTGPLEAAVQDGLLGIEVSEGEPALFYRGLRFPLSEESRARGPALVGDPAALRDLLEEQHYRLVAWRRGPSYRRFFETDTLVALNQETPEVFEETHRLIFDWAGEATTHALRIDHIDGLRDPRGYLERLRERTPGVSLIVEKILQPGEELRRDWPVEGTTGYGFIHLMNRLFLEPEGEDSLTETYREFTGETGSFGDIVYESKLQVLTEELASDVARLARRLRRLTGEAHDGGAEAAVREAAASFPVYRTYVRAEDGEVGTEDARIIEDAFAAAHLRRPDLAPGLEALKEALLLRRGAEGADLAARFQQLTGPAAAKGIEDTAFYRYHRLTSLNEVGGDPGASGVGVEEFHEHNLRTLDAWPRSMLATTTHDTKRSEDVRARLAVLSEIPEAWRDAVHRWAAINEGARTNGIPDKPAEYLFYQTVVGAHPLTAPRARAYMLKAAREAKVHTSWRDEDPGYEEALLGFVETAMANDDFARDAAAFVRRMDSPGKVNSLAQTLIKCTSVGIPDFYQGSEVWDLRLVDPDNRRPVDYSIARRLIRSTSSMSAEEAWASEDEGSAKLFLISRALRARRMDPDGFGPKGGYEPLAAEGPASHRVVAYRRGDWITAVPRLTLGLTRPWGGEVLALPSGGWRDLLSGSVWEGAVEAAVLFSRFPVALLKKE